MIFLRRIIANYATIKLGEFACFAFLIMFFLILKIDFTDPIITFGSVWVLTTSFMGCIFSVIFKSDYDDDGTGVQITCIFTLLIIPLLHITAFLNFPLNFPI